ncbi:hypothetical protein OQA88_3212 [Cercophora sp. LCS_1]
MDQPPHQGVYMVPYQYPIDQYGNPMPNIQYQDKNSAAAHAYPPQSYNPQAAPLLVDNTYTGNVPQQTPRKRHQILGWKLEIFTLLLACGALVAMVVVLVRFDGKRVPEWEHSINLTTIVALISTFFRAALIAVMAEVISQAKWLWFGKSRRLIDLQRFDEASRGFAGALKFFATVPKTVIGTFGAAVIIVSAAIGPFTQQAIKTAVCQQPNPSANASIPVAGFANGNFYRFGAGLFRLNPDVQGALVNAVANPTGRDSVMSATCATGNCTFTEYNGITHSSMGLCSACLDISRFITLNGTRNYTLPNGLYINTAAQNPAINIQHNTLRWLPPDNFGDAAPAFTAALANVTTLTFTQASCDLSPGMNNCTNNLNVSSLGVRMRPIAVTCAVHPCLKNFLGRISNGELEEELISTLPASPANEGTFSGNGLHNYTALKTPCAVNDNVYDTSNFSLIPDASKFAVIPPEAHAFEHVVAPNGENVTAPYECIYKLYWVYAMALSDFLKQFLFNGRCVESMSLPGTLNCPNEVFWFNEFWADGQTNASWIEGIMDKFAVAATNKLRVDGRSMYFGEARPDVVGMAHDTTVCVQLDWVWLLLPAGLLVVGMLLLVGIIVHGLLESGQPVWKSSVLPLLYCGLVEQPRLGHAPSEGELAERAKKTEVALRSDGVVGFTTAVS